MDVLKTMLSPNPFKRNDPPHIHDNIALLMEQYWRSSAHSSVPLFAALQSGESSKFLAGWSWEAELPCTAEEGIWWCGNIPGRAWDFYDTNNNNN